jgi:hypothetical protein
MFYHGTKIEVQLGDRVRVNPWFLGWFRRPRNGIVCYIPGISPRHRHLEYEDVRKWAIRLEDQTVLAAAYDPPHGPSKRIEFVSRGSGGECKSDEILDETWEDAETEESQGH